MFDRRISIFTGHFGSGKTEVAVNYALEMSRYNDKTAIVDFDIVNPYFRTKDAKLELEQRGVWVITPMYANTNVDVPALPPEINSLFEKKEYKVVFDVGGDDVGARVLGRYRDSIESDDFEMFFVINTKRPMTDTPQKIEEMIRSIEYSSGLRVTKLINNTNLLSDTSREDILSGHRAIEKISSELNIPIAFVSGFDYILEGLKAQVSNTDFLFMDKYIRLPWE